MDISTKEALIDLIEKRVEDKIIEPTNADLLKKLIMNADSLNEAIMISELGTTYKRTGFHFDKRLEKVGDTIPYFKKNESLSFVANPKSKNHKLIIGDNYPALLNLLIQYRHSIDVIYIDPPYGKDDLGDFADENYDNAITRDNLLSMLYPRLILAKELLTDEGTIFCSIDDRNHAYVKCLFDEVFEESNFEGQIHWRRRHNQPNDKTKLLGIVAEHILVYSKNKQAHKSFGIGKVDLTGDFSNPDNDPRGPWASKPWKTGTNQTGTRYSITTPSGAVYDEEWMGDSETYNALLSDGRIYFPKNGKGSPRKKYYQSERAEEGQCASNWWNSDEFGCNQDATDEEKSIFNNDVPFKNPKPLKLIKALINLGSIKRDAVVLDFFAGSGTTGHAVMELNRMDGEEGKRTFILCTNNEVTTLNPNGIAVDVTTKRLKRVMTGTCYDGTDSFAWLDENEPYNDNLDVYDIATVSNFENIPGKTAFDVIDETLYGVKKFETLKEKVDWICKNFEITQRRLEE